MIGFIELRFIPGNEQTKFSWRRWKFWALPNGNGSLFIGRSGCSVGMLGEREEKMLKSKPICPICKCICKDTDDMHRHLEEKHNNMAGIDEELLETVKNRELLNG